MFTVWLVYFTICGAVLGSAVVTFIDRMKRRDNPFTLSKCVSCGHKLAFWELAPVVAYISLKGHCRYCGETIPQDILESEVRFALVGTTLYLGVMAWQSIF